MVTPLFSGRPAGSVGGFRAEGARLALEESVYMGGTEPKKTEQIVLVCDQSGPQQVKWAITKIG